MRRLPALPCKLECYNPSMEALSSQKPPRRDLLAVPRAISQAEKKLCLESKSPLYFSYLLEVELNYITGPVI